MRAESVSPARGKGITSLGWHAQGFRRVLYEGGKPYPRESFDWNSCLSGLIILRAGERGCEGCGVDLEGRRIYRTRFCRPCMAERTKKADRRITKERVQRLKDNRLCIWCAKDPAVEGSQFCEYHREKMKEFQKAHYLKKTLGDSRYIDCGVCGCLIRKNGNVKYCRPCSVDRNGAWHDRRRRKQFIEEGTCTQCGKAPSVKDRTCCKECSRKKSEIEISAYNERKEQGLCTQCGKVPKEKTLMCEECRLDKKRKEIRREIRKEE